MKKTKKEKGKRNHWKVSSLLVPPWMVRRERPMNLGSVIVLFYNEDWASFWTMVITRLFSYHLFSALFFTPFYIAWEFLFSTCLTFIPLLPPSLQKSSSFFYNEYVLLLEFCSVNLCLFKKPAFAISWIYKVNTKFVQ